MVNYATGGRCDYVTCGEKQYYIDTSNTFDHGWETMIFLSEDEQVVDWGDLYCENYVTQEQAMLRHEYIIEHLNEFIN